MLETLDLSLRLSPDDYVAQLDSAQLALRELAYQLYVQRRTLIVVYEGWDGAGKGGNIKRLTEKLDPRGYEVFSLGAPQGEDRTHHYLWRFWRRLKSPEEKQILVFDRSWYARVLVERVEGVCTEAEWRRAYREIADFERQLADFGMILAKFWIHISVEEQTRRLEARNAPEYQVWRRGNVDWQTREQRAAYEAAAEDMLLRTSASAAPWTVVEGDDKFYARVKVLRTVVELLSRELNYQPQNGENLPGSYPGRRSRRRQAKKHDL